MQTNQKVVRVQDQEWTLNECQRVQGLWITEKGCQSRRYTAAYGAYAFHMLKDMKTALSRFIESNQMKTVFMCGDCPKYGEPVEFFDEIVNYTLEVRKAMLSYMAGVTMEGECAEEVKQPVAEDPEFYGKAWPDLVVASDEEVEPSEEDVL